MNDLLARANKWLEISHGRDVNYCLVGQLANELSAAQAMNDKMAEALTAWQEARTRCCNEGGIENLGRLANAEHDLVKVLTAYEQEK